MRTVILVAAVAALTGCSQQAAEPAAEANVAATETPVATPAAMSLNETSWTYTEDGKQIQESIDAAGNYVANAGTEHHDHGTVAMVDGKACYDSAMDEEGPSCWTVVDTAIGETTETTNDKGEKLMVTRVAYVPMPPMN